MVVNSQSSKGRINYGPVTHDEFRELTLASISLYCFCALARECGNSLALDDVLTIVNTLAQPDWVAQKTEVLDGLITLGKFDLAYKTSSNGWAITPKGEAWVDWLVSCPLSSAGDRPASSYPWDDVRDIDIVVMRDMLAS